MAICFISFGGGFPYFKIDYRKKGTLTLTSLLEDLVEMNPHRNDIEQKVRMKIHTQKHKLYSSPLFAADFCA